MSISSGSSATLTSKRSCTSFRVLASVSSDTKVTARPLVPKRPARATWGRSQVRAGEEPGDTGDGEFNGPVSPSTVRENIEVRFPILQDCRRAGDGQEDEEREGEGDWV